MVAAQYTQLRLAWPSLIRPERYEDSPIGAYEQPAGMPIARRWFASAGLVGSLTTTLRALKCSGDDRRAYCGRRLIADRGGP